MFHSRMLLQQEYSQTSVFKVNYFLHYCLSKHFMQFLFPLLCATYLVHLIPLDLLKSVYLFTYYFQHFPVDQDNPQENCSRNWEIRY